MSETITKAQLRDEIVKLSEEQKKELPEGLDRFNLTQLFEVFAKLTGAPHPKQPATPAAGAVRASTPAPAPAPAPAPVPEALKAPEASEEEAVEAAKKKAPPAPEPKPKQEEKTKDRGPRKSESGRYIVAEGKVVHCIPGPIGAFQEIRVIDVGSEAELDALWAAGTIDAAKR